MHCILTSPDRSIPGLPWGWHFNPHTHTIPIPMGIPMGIPIPTAALKYTDRSATVMRGRMGEGVPTLKKLTQN